MAVLYQAGIGKAPTPYGLAAIHIDANNVLIAADGGIKYAVSAKPTVAKFSRYLAGYRSRIDDVIGDMGGEIPEVNTPVIDYGVEDPLLGHCCRDNSVALTMASLSHMCRICC